MTEFFKPLDFSEIAGAPHAIPKDAIKKFPIFQGNNAITAKYSFEGLKRTWSVIATMLSMTMMMSK